MSKYNEDDEDQGCSWGFRDDAIDEDYEEQRNAISMVLSIIEKGIGDESTPNENAFSGHPQKTIQRWFEHEGYEWEFKVDVVNNCFKCCLELPIGGQDVEIEAPSQAKRKDAIAATCLMACKVLDKAGLLFSWQKAKEIQAQRHESSDSDGEMIDETESHKAKKYAKKVISEVLNFDTLNTKWKEISEELQKLKAKLVTMNLKSKKSISTVPTSIQTGAGEDEDGDSLDVFMQKLEPDDPSSANSIEAKIQKTKLLKNIAELEKEQRKVEKLLKIAKPSFKLPALTTKPTLPSTPKQAEIFKMPTSLSLPGKKTESPVKININEQKKIDEVFKKPPVLARPVFKRNVASVFNDDDEEEQKEKKPKMSPLPMRGIEEEKAHEEQKYGLILKKSESKVQKTVTPQKAPQPEPNCKMYFEEDCYVEWTPPSNQKGDGKTGLNSKLGY